MKFCNVELKGKKVRFEWPMGIQGYPLGRRGVGAACRRAPSKMVSNIKARSTNRFRAQIVDRNGCSGK